MARQEKNESEPAPLDFEQAVRRLEDIVHSLEEGETGLNEALLRYEEGVKLLRQAYDLLERAERRIELLSGVDAEGNPITRPVEDQTTLSQDEQKHRQSRRRGLNEGGQSGQSRDDGSRSGDTDIDAPGGLF